MCDPTLIDAVLQKVAAKWVIDHALDAMFVQHAARFVICAKDDSFVKLRAAVTEDEYHGASVLFSQAHRGRFLMPAAQHQQLFEVPHVVKAAEGRRMDFNDWGFALEERQTVVEQTLPSCQAIFGQPINEIGECYVENICVVIGMTVTEWFG